MVAWKRASLGRAKLTLGLSGAFLLGVVAYTLWAQDYFTRWDMDMVNRSGHHIQDFKVQTFHNIFLFEDEQLLVGELPAGYEQTLELRNSARGAMLLKYTQQGEQYCYRVQREYCNWQDGDYITFLPDGELDAHLVVPCRAKRRELKPGRLRSKRHPLKETDTLRYWPCEAPPGSDAEVDAE